MTTLSLADIADLASVERPVVSMWRRRPKGSIHFPQADASGRFDAGEVATWMEATGRGNNPDFRTDLALRTLAGPAAESDRLARLEVLLAAKAVLDLDMTAVPFDDLLDEVDEIDPDDTFIQREVCSIPRQEYAELTEQVESLADAAWHTRNAYERVRNAVARRPHGHDPRLGHTLIDVVAGLAKSLSSRLVDINGTAADIAVAVAADEDHDPPKVTLAAPRGSARRDVLRRYHVHDIAPLVMVADGWTLEPGDVALQRLPDQVADALHEADNTALQLPLGGTAVIVGPAAALIAPVQGKVEQVRDDLLREGNLRAAVHLPPGLTRDGSRSHLALWVLHRGEDRGLRTADLSGARLNAVTAQSLLDDLFAAAADGGPHAYSLLRPVDPARIRAERLPLTAASPRRKGTSRTNPSDDATRIAALRRSLMDPLPDPFPYALATGDVRVIAEEISLDDAVRSRLIRVVSGCRVRDLPSGSHRHWSSTAVATQTPERVDLVALTRAAPHFRTTRPGDVIVTTSGRPAAVVDTEGGASVAYPARIFRVTGPELAPHALASVINALPPGATKWRSWRVPRLGMPRDRADKLLGLIETYDNALRRRQTEVDELRRLVSRSVLPGTITTTRMQHHEEKGQ